MSQIQDMINRKRDREKEREMKQSGTMRVFMLSFLVQFTTTSLPYMNDNGHADLSKALEQFGRCATANKASSRFDPDTLLKSGCFCDESCARYGDCCFDSPFFNRIHTKTYNSLECVSKGFLTLGDNPDQPVRFPFGIYQIMDCPSSWKNEEIRAECENTKYSHDFFSDKSVSGQDSQTFYKNMHCAICNGERRINILENTTIPAQCIPNTIKKCADDWEDDEIRNYCETYTSISIIHEEGTVFKNPFCAICNYVKDKLLLSPYEYKPKGKGEIHTRIDGDLSILFRRNSYKTYVFWTADRNVSSSIIDGTSDVEKSDKKSGSNLGNHPNSKLTFEKMVNGGCILGIPQDAIMSTGNKDKPTVTRCDGNLDQTFRIKCDEIDEVKANFSRKCKVYEIDSNMAYMTYSGLSVSIVFLGLHLTVFIFGATSRTLADKNLASYAFALLMAYICFMVGQLLDKYACFVISLLTYYFFLVSFLWLLTMSFDVWRTTCLVKTKLQPPSKNRNVTFIVFSIWNWSFPAITSLVLHYMETSLPKGVADSFRPNFATSSCWFEGDALLIYFAIPVTVIMTLNVLFFCSTAYMIYASKAEKSAGDVQYFLCCARLTVMMGLNWTLGSIASYVDKTGLWYAFILFNSLQGFFLCLSFTCKRNIFKELGATNKKNVRSLSAPLISGRSSEYSNNSRMARGSRSSSSYSADTTIELTKPV